jgi:subtilisin family serine protease
MHRYHGFVLAMVLVAAGLAAPQAQSGAGGRVLIRTPKPYAPVVQAIASRGGKVTHEYRYWDAIAAELPPAAVAAVSKLVGADAITKDHVIPAPTSVDTVRGRLAADPAWEQTAAEDAAVLGAAEIAALAQASPQAYLLNNAIANVSPLHAAGRTGAGIVVAVIDSGIRPGFPHISLDGSVIGCEDFVGDALGCSNFGNSGHGTFVAGMISANVVFTFPAASGFRNAVLAECPACFFNPPTNTQIPMIGTAPLSSIYALRVFPATGGAPTSRILAAMERAIELRQRFEAGDPAGVDIRIVNMSLGGPTVFAGRDLFDLATTALLDHDILPVVAAGNAGPSSLTTGSPGSAFGALTVGAASLAHNERILRRLQFGPVNGALYRPFLGTQTAFFSSRGPNADGRGDPDVVANGFACYGQGTGGTTGTISLGSGTSFATPSVAGVAALLRQAFPGATARQIRNAIIEAANPALIADGSGPLDRGAGYVDALAAYGRLASGLVPDTLVFDDHFTKNVKVNVERGTALDVRDGFVAEHAASLLPGQRHDILYRVGPNTRQVVVSLFNVTPALPPAQQNQLFGDDVLLSVHTAKVSSIGEGDYPVFEFTSGGTFTIDDPEAGVMRITVSGDWTNAGAVSADVSIVSLKEPLPKFTTQGKIEHGDLIAVPVPVPAGIAQAEFRLGWREDWGSYPASDVDLVLVDPNGATNTDGATLDNPEVVVIKNPAPGTWVALLSGFEIHTRFDRYELRVSLDGNVVKVK